MKTKKLFCAILIITMAVSLIPTMSITVFAADRCLQKGGDGVYHITNASLESADLGTSWMAFYLDVKNGYTFEGETVSLDANNLNISPVNGTYMIGSWSANNAKPFCGTFEGNGNTVEINYFGGGNDVGVFSHTNGATIRNLTVSGIVSGGMSVAGIVGNAYNTAFLNCTNNATVYGSNIYIGGVAGWTGGGSKFLNCINNGEIKGKNCVGGIIGYEGSAVTVENCIATGKVSATALAGAYPAEGDYMIYSSSGLCFGIQDDAEDLLQLWTASSSAAKVFTLTYDAQYDAYIITEKQSGLVLTADLGNVLSQDWVKVYRHQQQSDLPTLQRWKFVPDASGNCHIRSLAYDGWSMNVANGTEYEGANIIAYKYGGNDLFGLVPEPNQTMNTVLADAVSGYHNSDSSYEQCFYNKDKADSSYGIGFSDNAMKGISADIIDDKEYIMPNAINDYIEENNKETDGWSLAYLNANKELAFHPVGWTYYLNDKGERVEVTNAKIITPETEALTDDVYIVKGNVTVNHRLCTSICKNVILILADDASLTVNGGINLVESGIDYSSSITIASQSFGKHMGRLTANGSWECAGIGTMNEKGSKYFTINIYGGTITAIGGDGAAGIGSGKANEQGNKCGNITITGGSIKATGGYRAAGIGTGAIVYYSGRPGYNSCDNITISGGSIRANGGELAAGIGAGASNYTGNDTNKYESISVTGGSIIAAGGGNYAENIGRGNRADGGPVTYGEGINHQKKGSSEWVNLDYVEGKAATCETAGYREAYKVLTSKDYYSAFPYTEDDLIGDENAYNIWKSEGGDGYLTPLGHSYSYTGSYDAANQIYTLKKMCNGCHKEAQEKVLAYSVPKESYRSYLDVTDKAYINTGYKPTSNTHAVMDVNVNGATEYWFGMWNENYNKGAFALGNDGTNVYVGYGNDGGGRGNEVVSNGRHTVELNKNIAYIDGNALARLNTFGAFTLNYPLYLFAQNRSGTEAFIPDNQKITCHSFQILENDTLLHYYIPYVKDGVSGLYDLVNDEFFGNANTVGTMTAGIDDVITISGKEPTCGENGYKEHYYRTADDTYFEDFDCTIKIDDIDAWKKTGGGVIPATGNHIDETGDGYCDVCEYDMFATDCDITYLDKIINDDNTVTTKEANLDRVRIIGEDDTVWGTDTVDKTTWYLVDKDVTLKKRPEVKGKVAIVLKNGCTLTADKGITVEDNNSLSIYAQSENESEMGKLNITAPESETAIGGRNGENADIEKAAGNGGNCGIVVFCGGNISLTGMGNNCIGGGNGGRGIDFNELPQSYGHEYKESKRGADGGNGGNIYFCGGIVVFNSSENACIGGGNGGRGASMDGNVADTRSDVGGKGGNSGNIYFYSGKVMLNSTRNACIVGGNGGNGGSGGNGKSAARGSDGGNGGNIEKIDFYGGTVDFICGNDNCIRGGNGGAGGKGGHIESELYKDPGANGANGIIQEMCFYGGKETFLSTEASCFKADANGTYDYMTVTGTPEIKVGDNAETATPADKYNGEKYLSVVYINVPVEEDKLSLALDGNKFTVTATGKNAGKGVIAVALYDSEKCENLLDIKIFDIEKGDIPTGEFSQSGYVQAMWWASLNDAMPLCASAYGTIETVYVRVNFRGVKEVIGGQLCYCNYYPVFSNVPEGVHFYDESGYEYNSMNQRIAYATVPKGVTIHTLRVVTESWDTIFADSSERTYPYNARDVKGKFLENHLVGGNENTEKVWRFNRNQYEIPPAYNGVNIVDIWNSYKDGFLGNYDSVWSSTKNDDNLAYCYNCNLNLWMLQYTASNDEYILISRDFCAE